MTGRDVTIELPRHETRLPLRVIEYSPRPDSGGAGKHRGGLDVRRLFEATAPSVTPNTLLNRYV